MLSIKINFASKQVRGKWCLLLKRAIRTHSIRLKLKLKLSPNKIEFLWNYFIQLHVSLIRIFQCEITEISTLLLHHHSVKAKFHSIMFSHTQSKFPRQLTISPMSPQLTTNHFDNQWLRMTKSIEAGHFISADQVIMIMKLRLQPCNRWNCWKLLQRSPVIEKCVFSKKLCFQNRTCECKLP